MRFYRLNIRLEFYYDLLAVVAVGDVGYMDEIAVHVVYKLVECEIIGYVGVKGLQLLGGGACDVGCIAVYVLRGGNAADKRV